jgi:hypothetical protein
MAIDRINTGLSGVQPGGLVKLIPSSIVKGASGTATVDANGNVTISGTESVSLNDVFSSTYDNYQIVLALSASAGIYAQLRLRVSGSDASGANYDWGFNNVTPGGTAYQLAGSGATSSNVCRPSSGNDSMSSFVISNPFLSKQTVWSGTTSFNDGATIAVGGVFGGRHTLTNSYTGFSLLAASGTITGTIRVYGYA